MAVKPSRVPYLEIAAAIRDLIRSGQLAPGDQLKTVRALAAEHSVALGTVGAALEVLRSEGLIDTVRGKGSVVIATPADAQSQMALALESAVQDAEARLAERFGGENAALRDDVERLQAQMMAVYDRLGMTYPHERDTGREVS